MKSSIDFQHYVKFLGLVLVAAGIFVLFLDNRPGAEMPLLAGLFITLVVAGKTEDERSAMIRTTSLYIAFVVSYGIKLISTNLFDHKFIPFQLIEINHFLIMLLAIANILFYSRMFISKG